MLNWSLYTAFNPRRESYMERIKTKIAADFKRDAKVFLFRSQKDIRSRE